MEHVPVVAFVCLGPAKGRGGGLEQAETGKGDTSKADDQLESQSRYHGAHGRLM